MSRVNIGDLCLDVEIMGEGEPLLLIMGLGTDKRGWMLQTPFFVRKYKVIAYDNRGVGKSDVPPGPYSTKQMAEDAFALLKKLSIPKAHIVGVSMGGMIAQQLVLAHPEVVSKLVLGCTYAVVDEAVRETTQQLTEKILGKGKSFMDADLATLNLETIFYAMIDVVFTPAFLKENRPLIEGLYQEILKEEPSVEGFFYQLVATQTHNTLDALSQIQAPTLVITGDSDQLIPPDCSRKIARAIPGSQLEIMEGCGHGLNFEKPSEFNQRIDAFLSSSNGATGHD